MVDPGEADGVVLNDINAVGTQFLEVFLFERLVVGVIAETIEHGPYFHTLLTLLAQDIEKQRGNGVIAEVEVFQMDAAACLADVLEHTFKFFLARHDEADFIALCDINSLLTHVSGNE